MNWIGGLGSKRVWVAAGGVLFVLGKNFIPDFPFSEEQVVSVALMLGSLIVGDSFRGVGIKATHPALLVVEDAKGSKDA